MPICTKCDEDKPDSEFRTTVKEGKPYTYKHCHDCQREYVRNHYSNNKQAYVDKARTRNKRIMKELREKIVEYLKDKPCVDCGESDIRVLQFDHREPSEKLYPISTMIKNAMKWESVLKEIEKCDVRCANCHLKRTGIQFGWWSSLEE
jgi:hypothetical protein